MVVFRKVIQPGDGVRYPGKGDHVTIAYTGYLLEGEFGTGNEHRGKEFDTSVDRGDFQTQIGVGKVIRGWDEGVLDMSLGEKATLIISSDWAYKDRGFPNHIPPNADLIFDVELKGINQVKAGI